MKKSINTDSKFVPLIFQVIILLIWQFFTGSGKVPKYILPSPEDIIKALFSIIPGINIHIYTTLKEALLGFAISIAIAVIIVILMDNYKIVRNCIYPMLVVSQTIPIITLAPLFMIWFGFGIAPKIIAVVLVCFFPIVISLMDGLDSVDRDMINLLRTMGAGRFQIFRFVKFPGAIISFFSGLRIAATYSIMGAVIGEWLGGDAGLGVYMIRVKHSYALDKVFASIIIIVALSMALFGAIYLLQKLAAPWAVESKKEKYIE
ncbi:MAG: ABC transporter permease [Solirubrobacterales bacterium]